VRLYLGDPEYGSLGYDGHHDWAILEGRYTLAVLFEYAATLGLLDVDYVPPAHARDDFRHMWGADWIDALSRYDGLLAVRRTPLGSGSADGHDRSTTRGSPRAASPVGCPSRRSTSRTMPTSPSMKASSCSDKRSSSWNVSWNELPHMGGHQGTRPAM
jgi:hypothetical protein